MLDTLESPQSTCLQGSPDLKAAREVADYLGTRHHEFHFTVQVNITSYSCLQRSNNHLCHFYNLTLCLLTIPGRNRCFGGSDLPH